MHKIRYLDSFGVAYISKEIEKYVGHKNIEANIFRIQIFASVICRFFCVVFIYFMLNSKIITWFIFT